MLFWIPLYLTADTDDLAKAVLKAVIQHRSNKGKDEGLKELRILLPEGRLLHAFVQSLQTHGEKANESEQRKSEWLLYRFTAGTPHMR